MKIRIKIVILAVLVTGMVCSVEIIFLTGMN